MPLNVNNVDVTVAANGVFGTTSGILNGLLDASILDDPEIRVCVFIFFFFFFRSSSHFITTISRRLNGMTSWHRVHPYSLSFDADMLLACVV